MSKSRFRRPKLVTLLLCIPVLAIVVLALVGDRRSEKSNSESYPRYFDRALERFNSTEDPPFRQEQLNLMTIALKRMNRQKLNGERTLEYAAAVDTQRVVVEELGGTWSDEALSKIGAQTTLAAELVRSVSMQDDPEHANEVALALIYDVSRRVSEFPLDPSQPRPYVGHLKKHFAELKPEVRTRLMDAYFALSVLVAPSGYGDGLSETLQDATEVVVKGSSSSAIDSQSNRLLETVGALVDEPTSRDVVVGSPERSPLFFGSMIRASIIGDWSTAQNQLATIANGEGASSRWYRHNIRVLGSLVTFVFMDRFTRGAPIDQQFLNGLDLCFQVDGGADDLCLLVHEIVQGESSSVALGAEEGIQRSNKVLALMDGNPASNSSQLVAILRGAKNLVFGDDPTTIDEALDVAEVLNATVLPQLIRQAFWELRTFPNAEKHVTCAAVRRWVKRSSGKMSDGELSASLKDYGGYAYYLSACAALEDDEIAEAAEQVEMSRKLDGPAEGIAALEKRLSDRLAKSESAP